MRQFEYILLRYAPKLTSDDAFTFGVVLFDPKNIQAGFCQTRFFPNWQTKVSEIDPNADTELLAALAGDIELRLNDPVTREETLHVMTDSCSNAIRCDRRGCLTENPAVKLSALAEAHSSWGTRT